MAKPIMIQGTMSGVGKSVVAAGLCRIFHQDGYRVAPFKSQNMSLNSYITNEGLEMGRAQVMQAEAAGVEPAAAMNPILLKPSSDTGSQVIVNGEVRGTMRAEQYYRMKKDLIPDIMRSYRSLDEAFDILVIEGAGSPAEINLKQDDIVNMGMARMAGAPVLLVGDIDRGGVFAQIYGTAALLDQEERSLIRGLIINKFRGDRAILDPGLQKLYELTGIPVIGVTPYLDLHLDDEDSLSDRLDAHPAADRIDLAVIRFPHISNFTDFNIFEGIDGVSLRYVSSVRELENPDLIFLPGTKNTIHDLLWMRQNGLEASILKALRRGTVLFGICGGYQMLGRTLRDESAVEEGGCIRGMGLFDIDTVFEKEKLRTRVQGHFAAISGVLSPLTGAPIDGYEIHMGQSVSEKGTCCPLTQITDTISGIKKADGAQQGNVFGTYVHGLFDQRETAEALILSLAEAKGLPAGEADIPEDYAKRKERQYDLLADSLRAHLDMEAVYEILEAGI